MKVVTPYCTLTEATITLGFRTSSLVTALLGACWELASGFGIPTANEKVNICRRVVNKNHTFGVPFNIIGGRGSGLSKTSFFNKFI